MRYCSSYSGHRLELDVYTGGRPKCQKLAILEVELQDIGELVEFPPELELEEVTGDPQYSNRSLAESK